MGFRAKLVVSLKFDPLKQLELRLLVDGQNSIPSEKTVTESCTYIEGEGRGINDCCRQKPGK